MRCCGTSEIAVLNMTHDRIFNFYGISRYAHLRIRAKVVGNLAVPIFVSYCDDMRQYIPIYTASFLCFVDRVSLYNLVNKSTRRTILFNIFIYFSSLHVSGIHVPIIRRKMMYLCDTGICHSVWVASGLLIGFSIQTADQTPPIQSDIIQVSYKYSKFLLMMDT